jgi:hypothetical protein
MPVPRIVGIVNITEDSLRAALLPWRQRAPSQRMSQ